MEEGQQPGTFLKNQLRQGGGKKGWNLTGETLEPMPGFTQWVSGGFRPVRFPVGTRVRSSDQGKFPARQPCKHPPPPRLVPISESLEPWAGLGWGRCGGNSWLRSRVSAPGGSLSDR